MTTLPPSWTRCGRAGVFTNHKLNWAAFASAALVLLVLFTPLRTLFGLIMLPGNLYLISLGLILTPVLALSKPCGLIKHHH